MEREMATKRDADREISIWRFRKRDRYDFGRGARKGEGGEGEEGAGNDVESGKVGRGRREE